MTLKPVPTIDKFFMTSAFGMFVWMVLPPPSHGWEIILGGLTIGVITTGVLTFLGHMLDLIALGQQIGRKD